MASIPLLATLTLEPGGLPSFIAGALLYVGSPITVVIAQDLAPGAPASAAGMVLGVSAALAGTLYVTLGRLQELLGSPPAWPSASPSPARQHSGAQG